MIEVAPPSTAVAASSFSTSSTTSTHLYHLSSLSSNTNNNKQQQQHELTTISFFTTITTYLSFMILILFGKIRDSLGTLTGKSRYVKELKPTAKITPVVSGWERFYTRRLFNRIQDCWSRPVVGRPSTWITLAERVEIEDLGMGGRMKIRLNEIKHQRVLNLGSYNYLGFADDDWSNTCGEFVHQALVQSGTSCTSGPISQIPAITPLHRQLERDIASFIGKEDAVIFGTGYSTNAWALKTLVGPGVLVVSDSLNHTSIVNGCRSSGAKTITFAHNDVADLEKTLRTAFTNKANGYDFKRILVIVEGLYSMEGHSCQLKEIVAVCKRYKAHIYVDEAHSIGALGATGRGVCELKGVDPTQVDVLMGTFTKSFGGLGGYIAGSKLLCDKLRLARLSAPNTAMSPIVVAQILRALYLLRDTELGKKKLRALQENSRIFRNGLIQMGCTVLGEASSPIIPIMIYHPAKLAAFSRECLERGLAVVVVGAPAVPLVGGRARFCLSASHTPEELKWALKELKVVCKKLRLRYEMSPLG
jgi:serine palmitoyltransferase